MRNTKKITAIFIASIATCVMLFAPSAKAMVDPNGKKQLTVCTISSGGTVTKVGDTCGGSGDGCTPNPCD
jgi:hypothetical protein